jgi:hypothetical protein
LLLEGLHRWIGDEFKTNAALRRHLHEVSYEPVGDVHVDSLFYSEGMKPDRIDRLAISWIRSSEEYEPLWETLRQNLRNLIMRQREEHVRDIPLLELSGLGSSKSSGPWKTLGEFGRSTACQGIPGSSDADFQRNRTHSFPQCHQPFCIWKVWWNGRGWSGAGARASGVKSGTRGLLYTAIKSWGSLHRESHCLAHSVIYVCLSALAALYMAQASGTDIPAIPRWISRAS